MKLPNTSYILNIFKLAAIAFYLEGDWRGVFLQYLEDKKKTGNLSLQEGLLVIWAHKPAKEFESFINSDNFMQLFEKFKR